MNDAPAPALTRRNTIDQVTLEGSVSSALLVVLETMTPAERVAFVLHDVFSVPFPEIAQIVGRTSAVVAWRSSTSGATRFCETRWRIGRAACRDARGSGPSSDRFRATTYASLSLPSAHDPGTATSRRFSARP